MRNLKLWVAAAAVSVTVMSAALADATGKWTWMQRRGQNGQEMTRTLELKQEGEKLTGFMLGRNDMKIEIKEATVKGNEISFVTITDRNGQQMKTMYKGKVEGDLIKGSIITTRDGQERNRPWEAKRAK
jgi:hypothetical protein